MWATGKSAARREENILWEEVCLLSFCGSKFRSGRCGTAAWLWSTHVIRAPAVSSKIAVRSSAMVDLLVILSECLLGVIPAAV
jgi:hypothetical protein